MNQAATTISETVYQTPDLVRLLRRPAPFPGQRLVIRGRGTQAWDEAERLLPCP